MNESIRKLKYEKLLKYKAKLEATISELPDGPKRRFFEQDLKLTLKRIELYRG